MIHDVERLARNRFIDPDKLKLFATENAALLNVIVDGDAVLVHTWYVNDLISAYREHDPEVYKADRQKYWEQTQSNVQLIWK